MKRKRSMIFGLIFAALSLLLAGCTEVPVSPGPSKGVVAVRVGRIGGGRTLVPAGNLAPTGIRVTGTGPGGLETTIDLVSGYGEAALDPGSWTFVAEGRDETGTVIASGCGAADILPGMKASVSITLLPVPGKGSFSLQASCSGSAASGFTLEGELVEEDGTASYPLESGTTSGSWTLANLDSGYYRLTLELKNDTETYDGLAETVLILAGRETAATCSFSLASGSLSLSLSVDMRDPLPVLVDRSSRKRPVGSLSRYRLQNDSGDADVSWHVNGKESAVGRSAVVGRFTGRVPIASMPSFRAGSARVREAQPSKSSTVPRRRGMRGLIPLVRWTVSPP